MRPNHTLLKYSIDFSKIKIEKDAGGHKGDVEESLTQSIIGILSATGNKSLKVDTSPGEVLIPQQKIQALSDYLNSNGVVTNPELLNMHRADITQRILTNVMKGSKITHRDISILSDLATLELPFAN